MSGGTAVFQAIAAGRHVIGNDLNSLATFVKKVKINPLGSHEISAIRRWAADDVSSP